LRTPHLLMNFRSGARKGDNQTYIDLLSFGQHNVKGRPTLVYHA
jgi:hypothetical protein